MLAALTLGALAALAAPQPARADPVLGIGEQVPAMFTDPYWTQLGLHDVRVVVAWDVTRSRWQRREFDGYLQAAQRAGANVVVSFSRAREQRRERILPSPERYARAFASFRKRWPQVTQFIPWNEANHCSQPTCRRPDMAAAYFDEIAWACPTCTIVAADVLDASDMPRWVRAFRRAAVHTPRIWGLHNYIDANRFRTRGTRALLRAVKGDIWFTETGGIVMRKHKGRSADVPLPESPSHAAKATRWVFRLAALSPRIKRVYLYHWSPVAPGRKQTWDSALLSPHGKPRPAYDVVSNWLRRTRSAG